MDGWEAIRFQEGAKRSGVTDIDTLYISFVIIGNGRKEEGTLYALHGVQTPLKRKAVKQMKDSAQGR